jgi:hypothetical protein
MARVALLTLAAGAVCGAVIVVGGRSEPAVSAIPAVSAPTVSSGSEQNGPEALLVRTMREINANRLDGALAEVDRIIGAYPNFRLAHLIKGDILLARTRPLTTLGDVNGVPLDQIEDLREEARVRIARHERRPPPTHVPRYLVQLNAEQQHAFVVDTYSRPPRSSNGCVALTNEDFQTLTGRVQIGLTPVVITHGVDWVAPEAVAAVRRELTDQLERWRRDWESLETERYLQHYAAAFSSGRSSLEEWSAHKRRVNSRKKWVKVKLDKVSIVLYPGRDDLAVITFSQDYKSSNFKNRLRKRQYWMKDGGSWRILYEGSA